ncbi:MAG: nucleotidyltransferase domain-containing protein, partial [Candidatus Woesearchaeota archaeon]
MVKAENKIINNFANKVKKDFPDAKIILFGSRAKGNALKESDYDIVVISNLFKETKMIKRISTLSKYWERDEIPVDILAYTYGEFEEWSSYLTIAGKA